MIVHDGGNKQQYDNEQENYKVISNNSYNDGHNIIELLLSG